MIELCPGSPPSGLKCYLADDLTGLKKSPRACLKAELHSAHGSPKKKALRWRSKALNDRTFGFLIMKGENCLKKCFQLFRVARIERINSLSPLGAC